MPIDNYPDDKKDWLAARKKIDKYLRIVKIKNASWVKNVSFFRNILKYPVKALLWPLTFNHIGRQCQKLLKSFNKTETKHKGQMACLWHEPWVFDADLVDGFVEVEFEEHKFPAIKGYDAYLRNQYGDYMQLPPLEKRVAKHDYKAYWKD